MKKTLRDCKRFKIIFCTISILFGIAGTIMIPVFVINRIMNSPLGFFIPLFLIILGFGFFIAALITMKIYVYNIDNHEVICFCGFTHDFLIVDEVVVDRGGMSGFTAPVLTHKLGNKHLEFSHKRLKVNGEMVMPNKK